MSELKTTSEQFELFKAECQKWIDIFGLKDWEFYFKHKNHGKGNVAYCCRNSDSRIAELALCEIWPDDPVISMTDENIRKAAFEEVCHIFLYRLSSNAYARFIMEHEINEAEHSIIRVLQNTLYPKY